MIDEEMKAAEKACKYYCAGDCLRNWEKEIDESEDLMDWLKKNKKCKDCSVVTRVTLWLEKNS